MGKVIGIYWQEFFLQKYEFAVDFLFWQQDVEMPPGLRFLKDTFHKWHEFNPNLSKSITQTNQYNHHDPSSVT